MRRSHSSETLENAANVNSGKRHCSCSARLWHSEALQKRNLHAIAHGMMVLPHQSETQLCWCKRTPISWAGTSDPRSCYQENTSKQKLGDFQDCPKCIRYAAQPSQNPCVSMQKFISIARFSLQELKLGSTKVTWWQRRWWTSPKSHEGLHAGRQRSSKRCSTGAPRKSLPQAAYPK